MNGMISIKTSWTNVFRTIESKEKRHHICVPDFGALTSVSGVICTSFGHSTTSRKSAYQIQIMRWRACSQTSKQRSGFTVESVRNIARSCLTNTSNVTSEKRHRRRNKASPAATVRELRGAPEKGPPRTRLLPVLSPKMSTHNFLMIIYHPKCPGDLTLFC